MDIAIATPTQPSAERSLIQKVLARLPHAATWQGITSLADQGIVSAANFATGVIIARSCTKDELGLYMLGFSLILLVTDLQTSLIATPYMIYAPRLKGEAHALYTGSTLIHQLALCFLTMLALTGGAMAITHGVGPRGLGPVLWALAAVAGLIMLREYARRICFACLKLKNVLLFDACIAAAQVGGLLLLAHFGLLSASRAYWLIGSASGIAVAWWLWSERRFCRPRLGESLADLKRNWLCGKWVFASGLIWTLSINLYPWLLAAFYGTASVGIWAVCLGVVALGNPAVLGAQNFLGPKIAHVYAEKGAGALRRFVLRTSAIIALPMVLFGMAMTLLGGPLVTLLYGHKYAGNRLVVTILAFNLAVGVLAFSFSRALFSVERADVDFAVNFVGLFIMLTLGIWLVRSFGVTGAAYGLLTANAAASGVRYIAFRIFVQSETIKHIA